MPFFFQDGFPKIKLSIKKPHWWQLTTEIWLDTFELPTFIKMVESMNLRWTETEVKHKIASLAPQDNVIKKINQGLDANYALTGIHSTRRDMSDFPKVLSPAYLQSMDYGFGNNVKLVGIPMVTLTYPTSDLIFCALQQEEKFWDFLESTKDDRHLLPDDLVGVIISALLTR